MWSKVVEGVGEGTGSIVASETDSNSRFDTALVQVSKPNSSNNLTLEKQLTWNDLQAKTPLGGTAEPCLTATPKGDCAAAKKQAKKQAKLPKKKKPSKLANKLMQFLKKVKRWTQKRNRQKKQQNPDKENLDSKSDKARNPR